MRIFRLSFRGLYFTVYNGNYTGGKLNKYKIPVVGPRINQYKLIFNLHIEDHQTQTVWFLKKKNSIWSKKSRENWDLRFGPLQ